MPSDLTPEQILAQQSHVARAVRAQHQASLERVRDLALQYSAIILGFDANNGVYRCQLLDGTIVMARSISNVGGKGIGDAVSLSKSAGVNVIRYL